MMTPSPPLWPCDTPWLTPDWRWRRACTIVERGGYATRARDGSVVQRTVRYLRASQRVCTDRGLRRVVRDCPDIHLAIRLQSEPGLRPLEVRARLLAGQTDRQIARRVGVPVPAVAAYAELYFDVRPRLEASVWIKWVAIGLRHDRPPSLESLLLTQAWRRGPEVIPAWVDYLQHQGERHDLKTETGRQRAAIQFLVAVQQLPLKAETQKSLWRRYSYLITHSPKSVKSPSISGVFSENAARFQREIGWREETSGRGEPLCPEGQPHNPRKESQSERLGQVG